MDIERIKRFLGLVLPSKKVCKEIIIGSPIIALMAGIVTSPVIIISLVCVKALGLSADDAMSVGVSIYILILIVIYVVGSIIEKWKESK